MASFDIVLQTSSSLHPDGEPTDYISNYTGFIQCYRDDDGSVTRVGKVRAYRIHAALAADHGESLFDVCDAHSHELHLCHQLPAGHTFKEALVDWFDAMDPDCLVIDFVVVQPKWRGLKLGLLAVRKMIDLLGGGCGLAVSRILPLNPDAKDFIGVPESWLPWQETPQERKEAGKKLRRYFRRMGFQRIGKTSFYGLSMVQKTPSLQDLLKPSV